MPCAIYVWYVPSLWLTACWLQQALHTSLAVHIAWFATIIIITCVAGIAYDHELANINGHTSAITVAVFDCT